MRRLRRGLSPEEKACVSKSICDRIVKSVGCGHPFCACPHAQQDEARGRSDGASEADAQRAIAIAVYLASPDEIDLTPAIGALLACGLSVVAPRWNGTTYDLARLKGAPPSPFDQSNNPTIPTIRQFRRGPMGILEPREPDLVPPRDVSLWLVPGLAFTRAGARLGYGGGWYDRLLAAADPAARTFGVAYDFQIVDALPTDPRDIPLDGLILPARTLFVV